MTDAAPTPRVPTPRVNAEAFDQVCCGDEYDIRRFVSPEGEYVDADFARQLERELVAAEAREKRLREALAEAIDSVESWAAYATEYFQEKHDLAGNLAALRAALAETGHD